MLTKYSSYWRLLRITAYIKRFSHNCRGNRMTGPLTTEEMNAADMDHAGSTIRRPKVSRQPPKGRARHIEICWTSTRVLTNLPTTRSFPCPLVNISPSQRTTSRGSIHHYGELTRKILDTKAAVDGEKRSSQVQRLSKISWQNRSQLLSSQAYLCLEPSLLIPSQLLEWISRGLPYTNIRRRREKLTLRYSPVQHMCRARKTLPRFVSK